MKSSATPALISEKVLSYIPNSFSNIRKAFRICYDASSNSNILCLYVGRKRRMDERRQKEEQKS